MNFRRLLPYLTPHRRTLLAVVILLLANSAAALLQPWLAGRLTQDLLQDSSNLAALHGWLALWAVLIVCRGILGFATQYTLGNTGEQLTARLRSRLFQHAQGLPLGYHRQRNSGEVLALLSNDTEQISSFVTHTLVQLLPLFFTFCGAMIMIAVIDLPSAALTLLLIPALLLLVKIPGRRLRTLSRDWMEAYSGMIAFVNEALVMLPAIKSFARESVERNRFDERNAQVADLARNRLRLQALLSPVVGACAGLGVLALVWAGSARIASGHLDAAALVSLLLYALILIQPVRGLANVYGQTQVARGAAERIIEFLSTETEPDAEGLPDLPPIRGDIQFRDIYFEYSQGKAALAGLSLTISAGETVAITGPNGAGKSTLAYLLLRLAELQSGLISIDGTDIRSVAVHSLRRQIGLVAQHTLLMNGTVAENIAYGKPGARPEEIARAARAAHAHEFISRLPRGYDNVIGEQGLQLSGGQRQRIALARSLLLDPQVLILDEATSMFDPATEERFVAEYHQALQEKTVLLITHRPASLALADRVIHLEEGRVCPDQPIPRTGGGAR